MSAAVLEVLFCGSLLATIARHTQGGSWYTTPRRTVGDRALREVKRFSRAGVFNYTTLRLDEERQVLYVGAREAIFALDMQDITKELNKAILWDAPADKKMECIQKGKNNQTDCFNYIRFLQSFNSTHLYTCGTYAFQPKCTYIEVRNFTLNKMAMEDGKGKCPYDPTKGHTGLIVDGELYSATLNNFLGTEPVILRNLGHHYSMKTEYLAYWLNEPNFVGSAYVEESGDSEVGDDDKIYFFFSERAVEYDCYSGQEVARVARVCKGDLGGARTLQKKWTTFLKARLVCSVPEQQLHFNKLQTIYTLTGSTWRHTLFFGIFRARWSDLDVSAICLYRIEDIQKAFHGPYKEYRVQEQKWGRYSDQVPRPRPGACITNSHRMSGYNTSLELPDNILNFAKKHPLMDDQILPVGHKPLLIQRNINYTHIAVHRAEAWNRNQYHVMFIGTGTGWLHKAVIIGSRIHIIEELQLFNEPVESLAISNNKKMLFVGSRSQIVQVPFADCRKYQSCEDCILARDPHCAWNSRTCTHIDSLLNVLVAYQDIDQADISLCRNVMPSTGEVQLKNLTVAPGVDIRLMCQLMSNLARAKWMIDRHYLRTDEGSYETQTNALIISDVQPHHAGKYWCYSEENGERFLADRYLLTVVSNPPFVLGRGGSLDGGWLVILTLAFICVCLFIAVLFLSWKLKAHQLKRGGGVARRTAETPISAADPTKDHHQPQPPSSSQTSAGSEEKLWESPSYHYSDGSLKIVPGNALCRNGGSPGQNGSNGIPGQPLPTTPAIGNASAVGSAAPARINLPGVRGTATNNGYVRLQLTGEEAFSEELRKKLKQRQMLPDANPEESSV
ncbi:semaphorin-4C [Callorhinchus milii]|uniref:semaphorin-4C n=1 Tax=Callorhinchus milii TaxID=7868 RepID=UPI0004573BFF|nr:semaphorin-4C [Callorhinchus milii]|eukprot:gi/632981096/ref/XP_007907401.1/ PREDICTED: semaphorin-4C [Callorhinchus milii]